MIKLRRNIMLAVLLTVTQLLLLTECTRPVILVHGINLDGTLTDWSSMIQYIKTEISNQTEITVVRIYDNKTSISTNMWTQVHNTYTEIKPVLDKAKDGVTIICYSQGGLTCRCIIEYYSNHNVHTFISLSAPLMGQYGIPDELHHIFHGLNKKDAYKFAYTPLFQRTISIANYWNDPYQQHLFNKICIFLPQLNNCSTPDLADCKENFLKVKQVVLIGGPDDEVIKPWQSSQFGFYATNNDTTVLSMEQTEAYALNAFGLQDMANRITVYTVPGIQHHEWITEKIIFQYIKQWLT